MRIAPVSLSTARLLLRPFLDQDIPALVVALNERTVACRLRNIPHPFTESHARERVAASREGMREGTMHNFAITCDERLIGGVGVAFADECASTCAGSATAPRAVGTSASVGYWIAREQWGHGYAREALQRLVVHVFAQESPKVDRIEAHVHVGNEASRRVLEACGFREEAIDLIPDCGLDGEQRAHRYALARTEHDSHHFSR